MIVFNLYQLKSGRSETMKDVCSSDVQESINALHSAIRKSDRALVQMVQKGASTTLISKRLNALKVGLILLQNDGELMMNPMDRSDLTDTKVLLESLLTSIERMYRQSKSGSSQRTLLEKRITALYLVLRKIDEQL